MSVLVPLFWLVAGLALAGMILEVSVWLRSRREDVAREVWLVDSDPRRTWNRI